jgi:hypothetical protein
MLFCLIKNIPDKRWLFKGNFDFFTNPFFMVMIGFYS